MLPVARTPILLSLLCLTGTALSAPVDGDAAMAAARNWLSPRIGSAAVSSLRLDPIPGAAEPVLWLASSEGGGFVWLRGDDRLPPVAGWSESGETPWPVENPALADWVELQRLDVEGARALDWSAPDAAASWEALAAAPAERAARDERDVAPLLFSGWDQGWPWNQLCPADAAGPGGRVWAGCVATAMGQVLYYWGSPAFGAGSHGYVHPVYGLQQATFMGHEYDWDGMLPVQGTASAAELLYHCAVAVEMDFSPSGSGAYVGTGQHSALHAFTSYFGYPERAHFILRTEYTATAWAERIAEEIVAGRPALLRGYGSGGHAFVLDGLQGGAFHVNWGWSGWYNGWYAIDALSPGGMDFSQGQGAIVDLAPNQPPQVTIPDQSVLAGQAFPPLALDACVEDFEDAAATIYWWAEEDGPLTILIDDATRVATVEYPVDWTGVAEAFFSALDTDGAYTTVSVHFAVEEGQAAPAAAVDDLSLVCIPEGVDLRWSAPTTDASGDGPAVVTGFEVHRSDDPWFLPSGLTLQATVPADSLSWRDEGRSTTAPCYYRVIVLGP